jgi:hypothetical protein
MAVTRTLNVIKATADADTIAGAGVICGIKVVGGAGGMTVNLKKTNTSGTIAYTCTVGNSSEKFEEVRLVCDGTLYVNVSAGSGTIYLYLK